MPEWTNLLRKGIKVYFCGKSMSGALIHSPKKVCAWKQGGRHIAHSRNTAWLFHCMYLFFFKKGPLLLFSHLFFLLLLFFLQIWREKLERGPLQDVHISRYADLLPPLFSFPYCFPLSRAKRRKRGCEKKRREGEEIRSKGTLMFTAITGRGKAAIEFTSFI